MMWKRCPACGFGPVNDLDANCSVCGASLAELRAKHLARLRAEIKRLEEQILVLEALQRAPQNGEA